MDSFYPNITIFEMIIRTNIIYSEYFWGEKRDSNDCLEFVINNNWKIGEIYRCLARDGYASKNDISGNISRDA